MKLQFFFKVADEDQSKTKLKLTWTEDEKQTYVREWHSTVRQYWNKPNAGVLSDGDPINITFNFHIIEDGWMWDHFEIDVYKIADDFPEYGYVRFSPFVSDVQLDNASVTTLEKSAKNKSTIKQRLLNNDLMTYQIIYRDDTPVMIKGHRVERIKGYYVKGYNVAAHEFGHMIGLEDEYIVGSEHEHDWASLMNKGPIVRDRHYLHLIDWANDRLTMASNREKRHLERRFF